MIHRQGRAATIVPTIIKSMYNRIHGQAIEKNILYLAQRALYVFYL